MISSLADLINVARTRLGSAATSTVNTQIVSLNLDLDTKNWLNTNKKFANVVFNIVSLDGVATWAYESYTLSDTRSVPVFLNLQTLEITYAEWLAAGNTGSLLTYINTLPWAALETWTPVLVQTQLTGRTVLRLDTFVGGTGDLPSGLADKIGKYKKSDGTFTTDPALALDITAELKAVVQLNTDKVETLADETDIDRAAAQAARTAAEAAKLAAEAAASTAVSVTNTTQINDMEGTAYVIEDLDGKIALKILQDGTVQGKFDITKIPLLFANMPDNVRQTTPEITDANFVDYAYAITDSDNKIALSIAADGTVKGKFDISQIQLLFNNLPENVKQSTPELTDANFVDYAYVITDIDNKIALSIAPDGTIRGKFDLAGVSIARESLAVAVQAVLPEQTNDGSGYVYAITDQDNKIAFAIDADGRVKGSLQLNIDEDFMRLNGYNANDLVQGDDDELWRGTQVEVPQKTLVTGFLFNRLPFLKCAGIRGVNDTGTDIEIRKSTGIVVRGKRNRGDYAPPLSSVLITYKGLFRSDATGLPASPVAGDYYMVVFNYTLSSPQTFYGVTMSHWDTLYYTGSAWQTIAWPMSNPSEYDFRTITAAGTYLGLTLEVGDRLIFIGQRSNGGYNNPICIKQKTGEFFCMGDFNPASFAPSVIRNYDLYVANAAGTYDSMAFAKGDYLIRFSGAWGKSASAITTVPAGKAFDLVCYNANEYGIRRADVSSTVVNFKANANVTLAIRRPSKDFALFSDSMFGYVGSYIASLFTDRNVDTFSYGGGTSYNIMSMIKNSIRSGDAMRARTQVFWHGQNNQTDLTQIKSVALEFANLCSAYNQRFIFWSMLGQQIFSWNGTRLVDANHEDAFNRVNNSRFIELEDWYDALFPNRHFSPRKAALAAAEAVPSLHFPGMTERQVADTYGITPCQFHVNLSADNLMPGQLNFVGYYSTAGLPTGGANNDYYIRTANGQVGEILVRVAGTWKALAYDVTHVTGYGGQKLAEQFKVFVNNNKF